MTTERHAQVASITRTIEATWRIEAAKIIATLTRYVGDFSVAEDLAQDALAQALADWPRAGVPDNPAAWLTATAKRRAIDGWRRRERFEKRMPLLADEQRRFEGAGEGELPWNPDEIDDDVLRLVFTSCHPVLAREAQLALTLRVVAGLTTEQIARAFLVPVPTVQQRVVRAKKTLAAANVEFELPGAAERVERLGGVLGVLYLLFSEGHVATSGGDWMRPELAMEALRLARVVAGLTPREPEVHGLAVWCAGRCRRAARVARRPEPGPLGSHADRARGALAYACGGAVGNPYRRNWPPRDRAVHTAGRDRRMSRGRPKIRVDRLASHRLDLRDPVPGCPVAGHRAEPGDRGGRGRRAGRGARACRRAHRRKAAQYLASAAERAR